MKKKLFTLLIALMHNQAFATVVTTITVSTTAALMGLSPWVWGCATFGAGYAYMMRKDAPRSRIINMFVSIVLAVFSSDAVASYLSDKHGVQGALLTPLIAMLIAGGFPWFAEKYLKK